MGWKGSCKDAAGSGLALRKAWVALKVMSSATGMQCKRGQKAPPCFSCWSLIPELFSYFSATRPCFKVSVKQGTYCWCSLIPDDGGWQLAGSEGDRFCSPRVDLHRVVVGYSLIGAV